MKPLMVPETKRDMLSGNIQWDDNSHCVYSVMAGILNTCCNSLETSIL